MSTFIATFKNLNDARKFTDEVLGNGLNPDDFSLMLKDLNGMPQPEPGSVGDASVFVGRIDDPTDPEFHEPQDPISGHQGGFAGIDTSNSDTDVESVDQAEDSQSLAEDMTYPALGISQGEHEVDDLSLAVETGFPTPVPMQDDFVDQGVADPETELDLIAVPGIGAVMGGGELATAALDLLNGNGAADSTLLIPALKDLGVPRDCATDFVDAFGSGRVLVAIGISPGEVKEDAVESAATRWGSTDGGLFDSPRY